MLRQSLLHGCPRRRRSIRVTSRKVVSVGGNSSLSEVVGTQYDAIIIGGGHNGLVTANYLAMKGLDVCVLESRSCLGGAAVTEEIIPGFKFSRGSYVSGLLRPHIISDLSLYENGYKTLPRIPSSFTPMPDGKYLMLGSDDDKQQIAKFSETDCSAYSDYEAMLERMATLVEPLLDTAPLSFIHPWRHSAMVSSIQSLRFQLRELSRASKLFLHFLKRLKDIPDLLELCTAPANRTLQKYFKSEPLLATLATDSVIGAMMSPSSTGSGYVLLHHLMGQTHGRRGVWAYVEGGMGALSNAFVRTAIEKGVKFVTDSPVRAVHIEGTGKQARATGVELLDGTVIKAKCIVSNTTADTTFLKLVDPMHLENKFLKNIQTISYASGVVKINLALSKLPHFKCCEPRPNGEPGLEHHGTIHFEHNLEQLEHAFGEAAAGIISTRPLVEMVIPSALDHTIAPEGQHVALLFCQYAPFELMGQGSADRELFVQRCLQVVEDAAPGFIDSIVGKEVLAGPDLEEVFGLTGGNVMHGAMSFDQLLFMRPVLGHGSYRSPVPGLYMCGASCHPGGGVMGAAGYNAATEILYDRSIGIGVD